MAMSIAIVIVLLGAVSYFNLAVEQFPDIAPPTVVVNATYPGASAETVTKAVIQPLEESINGVENMTYMTSTATNSGTISSRVLTPIWLPSTCRTVSPWHKVSCHRKSP